MGKVFDGRAENGNDKNRGRFNRICRGGDRHVAGRRIHLAVREHRDRAIVVGFARVLVDHFVQRGAGRHRVQQQNNTHQQGGQRRPAETENMAFLVLQTDC